MSKLRKGKAAVIFTGCGSDTICTATKFRRDPVYPCYDARGIIGTDGMFDMRMRLPIAMVGLLAFSALVALGAQGSDLVQATLLADTTAIRPGHPFKVGVVFKIAPQWHIYWTNPGDAGMASSVDLHLPPGFTASAWQFPVPTRLEQPGGIVSFGYEDQAMLIATLTPPANAISSDVTISADAKWLVCEKICLPGSAQLSVKLPMKEAARADHEDLFKSWLRKMPTALPGNSDIAANSEKIAGNELSITIDWRNDPPAQIQWFPPATPAVSFNDVRIQTSQKTTTISANLEFLAGQPIPTGALQSVLGYNLANETRGTIVPIDLSASAQR
jgi:DsbC/DsbD-like thiol-disulfide interchange protein